MHARLRTAKLKFKLAVSVRPRRSNEAACMTPFIRVLVNANDGEQSAKPISTKLNSVDTYKLHLSPLMHPPGSA